MASEDWARHIVEKELGRGVIIYDDGSKSSMCDLHVEARESADAIAIECVGAVNAKYTELWNIGPSKGPIYVSTKADWLVTIEVGSRLKTILGNLDTILQELETRKIFNTGALNGYGVDDEFLASIFSLGISHASSPRRDGTGKVLLTLPGIGGGVDDDGGKVASWVSTFLDDGPQRDVLHKLDLADTPHRQAFVIIGFSGAPFEVESYFTGDLQNLPLDRPSLPAPLDGVWIASTMGPKGVRWDGDGWKFFQIRSNK